MVDAYLRLSCTCTTIRLGSARLGSALTSLGEEKMLSSGRKE